MNSQNKIERYWLRIEKLCRKLNIGSCFVDDGGLGITLYPYSRFIVIGDGYENDGYADDFLQRCRAIGLKRLVFRQMYGDTQKWQIFDQLPQTSTYRHNPVFDYDGMEVTYWNFSQTASRAINLFSNGTISTQYLLTKTQSKT